MPAIHYLAYGSNLHPLRLAARIPSARFVGLAHLSGLSLAFHKRGSDGSGKCLLRPAQGAGSSIHGAIYEIDAADKPMLDAIEGPGYYSATPHEIRLAGKTISPFLYAAHESHVDPSQLPYHWYKALVLAGARHHRLPAGYIAAIEQSPSLPDPDIQRGRANEALLRAMSEQA